MSLNRSPSSHRATKSKIQMWWTNALGL